MSFFKNCAEFRANTGRAAVHHDSQAYEKHAEECLRLSCFTIDEDVRDQLLSLYRCYVDYAVYLREREGCEATIATARDNWSKIVNG